MPAPARTICARDWAARLDPDHPEALPAGEGFHLLVRHRPLLARGRRIHGLWDPRDRRIELYGAIDPNRSDTALVRTFAHELAHAVHASAPSMPDEAEASARDFAASFLAQLAPDSVARCAAALRKLAAPEPPVDAPGSSTLWMM